MHSHPDAPPESNEETLVTLARQGNQEAFGSLYIRHLDVIYRYIYFRVGDAAEAEDLTEEVFVRAWQGLTRYRAGEAPFKSWLYRIAHNLTVDYHRRRAPGPLTDRDLHGLAAANSSTEEVVEQQQAHRALAAAVQQLEDEEQAVVILRFMEGLSHQEVALTIGKSIEASRVIQHRALAKLSRILSS